jgi:hypothetical protein
VGSDSDIERYAADYGNLLLEVSAREMDHKRVFEYIVTDKTDGFTCWIGTASDFASAQSDAILEAQLFLDPYIASPPPPEWRLNSKKRTQI